MSKGVKIGIILGLPVLLLGIAWLLAKFGVIPVKSMAAKSPALASAFKAIGLYTPPPPPKKATTPAVVANAPDPLKTQQEAFDKERTALQQQIQNIQKANAQAQKAQQNAGPDPKEMARLAAIYEQMPADKVTKIFEKLPDAQVIALLRRMDEKQVAEIMATVPPERAARLTLNLSRPAPVVASRAAGSSP